MSASAFDHPWLSGLFADPAMAALWSAETQLAHMLAFEAAWSRALGAAGLLDAKAANAAAAVIERSAVDPGSLADGTGRDGLCVPSLVRMLRAQAGPDAVHTGATSQDVIDSALAMTLLATADLLAQRLARLDTALTGLQGRHGHRPLMGRTRMQAATRITVADRIESWRLPLVDHMARLSEIRPRIARVQIGGASGDRTTLGVHADAVTGAVAKALGLLPTDRSWHTRRDGVAEFAGLLSLISGSLGKMGQDICLMAQQGIETVTLAAGGGSSAMPHKQNPVKAELLVTLARFNAVQVSGLHHALIHEQERSGAAWTLEWMLLPQMAQATGRGLTGALELVADIDRLGDPGSEARA